MKFRFEQNLDHQIEAVAAVRDLFRGQRPSASDFAVADATGKTLPGVAESAVGVGNRLDLDDEALLSNLRAVQLRNGILPADALASRDFTVEMETGTGKTYVYLRTIFELNRCYGFTKFVIVVPSVAIKEGVDKSFGTMGAHFRALYAGAPFEHFVYDSARVGQLWNFAASALIQAMVVTVGAINKRDVNSIYQPNEKTGGERPIDLVRAANPILIVDEPQSVDGGLAGRGKQALEAMNPLCALRYSATHAQEYHMVYRLNAVDAYERKLVKQIEVAAGVVTDDHNRPYVRLVATRRQRRTIISATIEVDVATPGGGVRRRTMIVTDGDDLEWKTRRSIYAGHRIGEICVGKGNEYLELRLPHDDLWLHPGESYGSVDLSTVHRAMMRKTIQEHFDKERRLNGRGVKVLTLFFIDKVARYRQYGPDGEPLKGEYALMFEDEYRRAARRPANKALFAGTDAAEIAERAHGGYFSIDRKGNWTDTAENNRTQRDNAERAYNLIMRDKERLLDFEEPLKFIFSHSALREGWDNPNVFQICALRDIHTERARRQTIGRGLRLCVNQSGERLQGFDINTLTVIARESYEEFAENLQREIEEETGIRFGAVNAHGFASIRIDGGEGGDRYLGVEDSHVLWEGLISAGYLDRKGLATDKLRQALAAGNLELPDAVEPVREEIAAVLRRAIGRVEVRNADERRRLEPREAILESEEFKALWDRIKYKTTYRVRFDNERLLEECARALREAPPMPRPRLRWSIADVRLGRGGVEANLREDSAAHIADSEVELPDVLAALQNRTQLTRRSICRILIDSGRLEDFKLNPTKFIEIAAEAIERRKRLALVDGVKYERLGSGDYYTQELFRSEELTGYLKNMMKAEKSVYDRVIYDSANEAKFAEALEKYTEVKVYAKLPPWFRIPTPLGPYNPDWAVLVEDGEGERLYFVVESKGTAFLEELRNTERAKVECGKAHFKALAAGQPKPAMYRIARSADELRA